MVNLPIENNVEIHVYFANKGTFEKNPSENMIACHSPIYTHFTLSKNGNTSSTTKSAGYN